MRKTLPLLLTALTLAACTPAIMRVTDAAMEAQASTPYGQFTFNCNPVLNAQKAGAIMVMNSEQNAIACPSPDGRATLLLNIYTVSVPASSVTVNVAPSGQPAVYKDIPVPERRIGPITQVILILNPTGDAPLAFVSNATQKTLAKGSLFLTGALNGSFTATPAQGVTITGKYSFVTKREEQPQK